MSSSAPGGPSAPQDKEKKGLGKMLSRAKTLLKRPDGSRRFSTVASSKPTALTSNPAAAPAETTEAAPAAPAPAKSKYEDLEGVSKVPKAQVFEERARKLGERFGLEIKASEWYSTEGDALRVEKPIRMRIHRNCHKCETPFGMAKECPNCQHVRCTKCARYPPKRTEAERVASREKRAAIIKAHKDNAPIVPDYSYGFTSKDIVLKKPSKTGGQDLVFKKPRQRVRRTCHECSTLFISGSKQCESCGHVRCTDCPRDPPKKDKYPFGYPGDEFGPSAKPVHECHQCKTRYPADEPDGTECKKCQHKKCGECPRLKPRKVEPEPHPEIVKSLEAKLVGLKLG